MSAHPGEPTANHTGWQANIGCHLSAFFGELLAYFRECLVGCGGDEVFKHLAIVEPHCLFGDANAQDFQPPIHLHGDVTAAATGLGNDLAHRRLELLNLFLNLALILQEIHHRAEFFEHRGYSSAVSVSESSPTAGFGRVDRGGAIGLKSSSTCQICAPRASLAFLNSGRVWSDFFRSIAGAAEFIAPATCGFTTAFRSTSTRIVIVAPVTRLIDSCIRRMLVSFAQASYWRL